MRYVRPKISASPASSITGTIRISMKSLHISENSVSAARR
jgi:hypothetical protein